MMFTLSRSYNLQVPRVLHYIVRYRLHHADSISNNNRSLCAGVRLMRFVTSPKPYHQPERWPLIILITCGGG